MNFPERAAEFDPVPIRERQSVAVTSAGEVRQRVGFSGGPLLRAVYNSQYRLDSLTGVVGIKH